MEGVKDGLFPVVLCCVVSPRAAARHSTVALCSDGTCRRLYPTKAPQPDGKHSLQLHCVYFASSSGCQRAQCRLAPHPAGGPAPDCLLLCFFARSLQAAPSRPIQQPPLSTKEEVSRSSGEFVRSNSLCSNISNHQWDPLIGQHGPRALFVLRAFLNSLVRVKHKSVDSTWWAEGGSATVCKSGELLCLLCK